MSTFFELGALSWREAAQHAQVGFDAAQRTVENMARAGELVRCGEHKPAGACNWIGIYELAEPRAAAPADAALNDLAAVTAGWACFV